MITQLRTTYYNENTTQVLKIEQMNYENSPQPWEFADNFSGGGNVDILLILSTLLKMQCKWTVTKRFTLAALPHPVFF